MEITSQNFNLFITDENEFLEDYSEIKDLFETLFNKLDKKQSILSPVEFDKVSIELSVVTEEEIKSLNNEFRNKDKTTDVLSFPSQENIRNNEFEVMNNELVTGDILICYDVCKGQAIEHGIDFKSEFIHLFVHGLLHLYGYDHELSDDEEKIMESKEKELIDLIK